MCILSPYNEEELERLPNDTERIIFVHDGLS